MKLRALFLLAIPALCGCMTRTVTVTATDGVKYEYKSNHLLTNPNIGAIKVTKDSIGGYTFSIEGYNHNQAEITKLIMAIAAAKP